MRGTKKAEHRRFHPLCPLLSLIRFDPFPVLVPCMPCAQGRIRAKKEEQRRKGLPSFHEWRSFGLHFSCPPLPPFSYPHFSLFFLCWVETLSRSLCISLLSVISHSCSFPSPLSFLVPTFPPDKKIKEMRADERWERKGTR